MLKRILFTHDDMDGIGCRILFELYSNNLNPDEYRVYVCSNLNVNDIVADVLNNLKLGENPVIYFADICCNKELLTEIRDHYRNLVRFFDHHITNIEMIRELYPDYGTRTLTDIVDGKKASGTSLMYEQFRWEADFYQDKEYPEVGTNLKYFCNDYSHEILMERFVDAIRSWDTFEWKKSHNMQAKKLQMLFALLGSDPFYGLYMKRFLDMNLPSEESEDLIDPASMVFVNAKLRNEKKIIDTFDLDHIYDVNIKGCRTALVIETVNANIGDLAHQFLTKHPEFDLFVYFNLWGGGEYQFRTIREDLNTAEIIAAPIGGGGHAKSSGAPLDRTIRFNLVEMIKAQLNQRLDSVFLVESM